MPSELDGQLNAIMDGLTAPGAPLALGTADRNGVSYPVVASAPATLPALFEHYCTLHGDTPFLVDGALRLSFAETLALAKRVAAGLVGQHGVRKGDHIGIAARNSANWLIAYMGILMAGGVATLVNGWWTGEEMAEGIALAECTHVLADPPRAARLDGHECGAWIVMFDHGDPEVGLKAVLGESAELPEVLPEDPATILFTSGSTGASKGAISDHRGKVQAAVNFVAASLSVLTLFIQRGEAPTGQQCALVSVPFFHVTGEIPLFLVSIVIGRRLVLLNKWDAVEAMRLIEAEGVTYFVGVPLMSYEMATHPRRGEFNLSTCKNFAAGGAPRPPEHVTRIREAMPEGFPIIGYGLTETNAVGCGNFNENYLAKPDSTGPASRPLVEVAIYDDDGKPLPAGALGEIAIRSIANILGYWKNPEATRAAFTADGWFLSGDLGRLDEDGYLYIVDRKKEIIIRGGENIACIEVEQAIYAHPGVAECSVFGLPDDRFGEVPVAVYHPRAGHDFSNDELREFVAERIAAFKVPVCFIREDKPLPRLGTEKVDKRTLKARYGDCLASP